MGSAIKFSGQVALFRNDIKNQPCYNCLYNIKNEEKFIDKNNNIDRALLRDEIFKNEDKKEALESII